MKGKIIIEFNGAPATGKSTIISHLKTKSDIGILTIEDLIQQKPMIYRVIVKLICCFTSLMFFLSVSNKLNDKLWQIFKIIYSYKKYLIYINSISNGIIIIDEGAIQKSLSIFMRTRNNSVDYYNELYCKFLRKIKLNRTEILIESTSKVRQKRKLKRKLPQDYLRSDINSINYESSIFKQIKINKSNDINFLFFRNDFPSDMNLIIDKILSHIKTKY